MRNDEVAASLGCVLGIFETFLALVHRIVRETVVPGGSLLTLLHHRMVRHDSLVVLGESLVLTQLALLGAMGLVRYVPCRRLRNLLHEHLLLLLVGARCVRSHSLRNLVHAHFCRAAWRYTHLGNVHIRVHDGVVDHRVLVRAVGVARRREAAHLVVDVARLRVAESGRLSLAQLCVLLNLPVACRRSTFALAAVRHLLSLIWQIFFSSEGGLLESVPMVVVVISQHYLFFRVIDSLILSRLLSFMSLVYYCR